MKTQDVCEYRVRVNLDGENKIFDVRNSSAEQCKEDVKRAFGQYNPRAIEVKPIASLEFKRK